MSVIKWGECEIQSDHHYLFMAGGWVFSVCMEDSEAEKFANLHIKHLGPTA